MFNLTAKYSKSTLLLFISIAILVSPGFLKLRVNTDLDQFINQSSASFMQLKQVEKEFGSTNNLYILLTVNKGSILNQHSLRILKNIETQTRKLNGVKNTISILTIPDMKIDSNGIRAGKLIELTPKKNTQELQRELTHSHDIAKNIIFNNNTSTLIVINLFKNNVDKKYLNLNIQKIINKYSDQEHTAVYIGLAKIEHYLNKEVISSIAWLTPISGSLVFLCLLFFIRSIKAIAIVVIEILIACIITVGSMGLLGIPINLFTALAPTLIIVVGSTEIVHLIEAYFAKQALHTSNEKIIKDIVNSVYPSILLTSGTTIISFFTLSFSQLKMIEYFGIAATLGMIICAITILFLSPPLFILIFSKHETIKSRKKSVHLDKIKSALIHITLKYDRIVVLIFALLGIISLYLITTITPNYSLIDAFHRHPVKQELKYVQRQINGTSDLYVVIRSQEPDAFLYHENLTRLFALTKFIDQLPPVSSATSFANFIALMHKKLNNNIYKYYTIPKSDDIIDQYVTMINNVDLSNIINEDHNQVIIQIKHKYQDSQTLFPLMKTIRKQAKIMFKGPFTINIVSKQHAYLSSLKSFVSENVYSILALMVVLFLLFTTLFHSMLSGLLCFVINATPLLFLCGTVALFNLSPSPGCVMSFIIVFGIAVDDTIHFFTKYSHLASAHSSKLETIEEVFRYEFKPVLFTSISLIIGFLSLLSSNLTELLTGGILVPLGIFYALLCDLFLSPALLNRVRIINIVDLIKKSYDTSTLQTSPIFSGFSRVELKKALLMSRIRHIKQGTQLIKKGEFTKSMYVVVSGNAEVVSATETIPLTTGAVIGEMAYFSSSPRTADVFAQTDLTVVELNEKSLQSQMRFHKKIFFKLNTNAISIIISRLNK